LAIKRVTENKGKNTPGIDGIVWKTDKQKSEAVKELKKAGYVAQPLRRVIPKKKGIPVMSDRAMQALHLMALDPVAETILDQDRYGFRSERSTADAITGIFNVTARKKRRRMGTGRRHQRLF
jgi:RNA-directed DNA polymerase